jgi:hypothetical protein
MHGLLAVASQVLEDRPARRIRERLENIVCDHLGRLHDRIITIRLWIVNTFFRDHVGPNPLAVSPLVGYSISPLSKILCSFLIFIVRLKKYTASYPCISASDFLSLS